MLDLRYYAIAGMGAAGVTMIEVNGGLSRRRRVLALVCLGVYGWLLTREVVLYGLTRWTVVGLLVGLAAALAYGVRLRQFEALLTRWRVKRLWVEVMGAAALVGLAFLSLYHFEWSGFGTQIRPPFVEQSKTLWDWLQVLIVPIILFLGGVLINHTLQRNEQERAEKQAKVDQQIARKRDKTERDIAEGRAQDLRLQTYLDRMSELLLDRQLGDAEQVKDEVKALARTLTLTTLRGLDGERKGAVVKFLFESGLIGNPEREAIVRLNGADLVGAELQGAILDGANLSDVNLNSSKLTNVKLVNANLVYASLCDADLFGVNLVRADLRGVNLARADLRGVNLVGAKLVGADLHRAKLVGADLVNSDLGSTNLVSADLHSVDLGGANLFGAQLDGADLRYTSLRETKVTEEQLRGAMLNNNTILPDGTWYQGQWD
ncbi:MAG: pentapeptide repeat-containing protein [Anaerolineae bacterium]|nr:pentapeptide repeat-containing protein [Anaerolineae bacterium]